MYPLPDDILSYVHVDQSVLLGILSGVFLLPFPFLLMLLLFWCWQEELIQEHKVEFNRLESMGFVIHRSIFSPRYVFVRSQEHIALYVTPFLYWISVVYVNQRKRRKTLKQTELFSFIDSLDLVAPISKPPSG